VPVDFVDEDADLSPLVEGVVIVDIDAADAVINLINVSSI